MSAVIGIDVGGSTTKIVGYTDGGKLISVLKVEAADPLTSAYGALGKFINENNLTLPEVKQIILTGVGSSLSAAQVWAAARCWVCAVNCAGPPRLKRWWKWLPAALYSG